MGAKPSDTTECDFDIDEDLSPSKEGSYLITSVSTIFSEDLETPYINAGFANYRLGQAIIENFLYIPKSV